jgi:AraC-like DNA-binding protein
MGEGFRVERSELYREPHPIVGPCLALVARGELGARLASGDSARLREGDVFVVGPREGGALASRRGRAELIVFRVQGEWLARALALAGSEPDSALPRAATLRAGSEAAQRAARALRELARDAFHPDTAESLARAGRALELLSLAIQAPHEAPAPVRRRSQRGLALDAALDQLASQPLQELTLARFAASLGFSQRQASRLVRERLGRSFGSHVAELRLACARRLLAQSELPVIEVAAESGFGSLAHFHHVFRARTGRTPSGFRAHSRGRADTRIGDQEAAIGAGAGSRAADASARSSCFTIESSQAEKGVLPS